MTHKATWYFSVDPAFKSYSYALVRMWEIDDCIIEKINDITADMGNTAGNITQMLTKINTKLDNLYRGLHLRKRNKFEF